MHPGHEFISLLHLLRGFLREGISSRVCPFKLLLQPVLLLDSFLKFRTVFLLLVADHLLELLLEHLVLLLQLVFLLDESLSNLVCLLRHLVDLFIFLLELVPELLGQLLLLLQSAANFFHLVEQLLLLRERLHRLLGYLVFKVGNQCLFLLEFVLGVLVGELLLPELSFHLLDLPRSQLELHRSFLRPLSVLLSNLVRRLEESLLLLDMPLVFLSDFID